MSSEIIESPAVLPTVSPVLRLEERERRYKWAEDHLSHEPYNDEAYLQGQANVVEFFRAYRRTCRSDTRTSAHWIEVCETYMIHPRILHTQVIKVCKSIPPHHRPPTG